MRAASLGSWLQSQLLGWLPCSFSSLGTAPPPLRSKTTTFQLSGAALYYQSGAWHSAFLSRDLGEQLAGTLNRSLSASWLQWKGWDWWSHIQLHLGKPSILSFGHNLDKLGRLSGMARITNKITYNYESVWWFATFFFWTTLNMISSLVVSGPKNVCCHMNAWRAVPLYPLSSSDLAGNVKGNF